MNLREIALQVPQTTTTPEHVVLVLREAITSGVLKAGQALPADAIAAELEVSRSPVREALRQLETEGLIQYYPHRGAVVAALTERDILQIFEIRQILELGALELAFPHLGPADLQSLQDISERYEASTDLSEMKQLDVQFHETLYQLHRNPQLRDLISSLRMKVDGYWHMYMRLVRHKSRFEKDHRDLLLACESGDLQEARAVLKCHLEQTALMLMEQLKAEAHPPVRKRRVRPDQ
ncbi:GntR family transcriptional regulator [Deinococcus cellulosilyticus]|uniref:GntR family transcriptional regulator n=1 Tax=Deinococcus cellulosilyticus (strain DSM 18568 / NBRC 106333 / KACC 11606 / 5516J-15) TaxID=1223518 RepID=A0A511MWL4_DEIC1|nr:GntR family transcriptional regulator [Deinococcus cellulosilyticus]GEM44506.1 GntR family transcriptional regulator [Deinococcus cellulosilyticus NBRC 106333 = KACC 11606]